MPYISAEEKEFVEKTGIYKTAGQLNYRLTRVILSYWVNGPRNYQAINDIIGALDGAKAEFQRRIVAPYEDRKREQNGDVEGYGY